MSEIRVESPFPVAAWPRVWSWIEEFRSRVADDFGPRTLSEFVELQLGLEGRQKTWAVYKGGELCGMVSFEPSSDVTGTSHALFRRDFWGRATTEQALRLVYAEVFAGGTHKIVGTPFRDNHAMIALAHQVGFQKEGILREHTKRKGLYVDMVVMGMTQGDFERCQQQQS